MKVLSIVLLSMFFSLLNVQAVENSPTCKIKLIPKRDLRTFIFGFRTSWVVMPEISKYSDCVKVAEDTLLKVNGPFKAESLADLFGKIILSIFEPEYYKAVKITYTDVDGHRHKNKIKYKKNKNK